MLEILTSEYRGFAQDILAWSICFCALIWGGGPERIIATTWLILFEVSAAAYEALADHGFRLGEVDVFLATSDILACTIWLAVGLYANRNYTLWIAALQLLVVFAHLARGFAEAISPIAYAVMVIAPGWFQLILLATGLGMHLRRNSRFEINRDWRFSSGALEVRAPKGLDLWVVSLVINWRRWLQ